MLTRLRLLAGPTLGAALVFGLSAITASAVTPLVTSCVGIPGTSSISWTASSTGGVAPIAFLWGNGSTATTQVVSKTPGTYGMTIQVTDASSTIATSTCSATISASPTITSFTATPATITAGQSAVLSFAVVNASTTSINNGVGIVSGTSVTVTPAVTTVYTLSAINPNATTTASATVTVGTSTVPSGASAQLAALLQQLVALRAQIFQLMQAQGHGGANGTTTPPILVDGACNSFERNLSRGDSGDDVRELQKRLAKIPGIFPEGSVTGVFGELTEKAVKRFQKKHSLGNPSAASGFVGPITRAFWHKHCNDDANDADEDDDDNHIEHHGLMGSTTVMSNHHKDDKKEDGDGDHDNRKMSTSTASTMQSHNGSAGGSGGKHGGSGKDDEDDEDEKNDKSGRKDN